MAAVFISPEADKLTG